MRIGEFEITDRENSFRMEYVGPKRYLTTASSNNQWLKELLNKWYGRHEFVYTAPPLEFKQIPREKLDEMIRNSRLPDEILPLNYVGHIIFKKEKETAMEKDMKDYIGCYLKEVEFKPPYTTIFWSDDTSTQVKCVDEPYDPEKGFAMAVQKKLFGRNYYKNMESIIKRDGGYEKATPLIRIMDDYRGYLDSPIEHELASKNEEIEKLKKENDRLLTEVNTLDTVRYGIVKANEEFKKDLDKMRKMNRHVIFENKMLDDTNIALKSAVESLKKNNATYKKENEDLEKAKENMAKKLAETKSLRQENEELKIKLEDWMNSFNYQSKAMNQLRCKCIDLEKENAKYKDIVDMQKRYDELKEQYDLLTECHKRQAFTIGKQREEVEKLNQIKEILK